MNARLAKFLLLLLAGLGCLPAIGQDSPNPARGQKFALLIGIGDYAGAFNDLPFCHSDLRALETCLFANGFARENVLFLREDSGDESLIPTKEKILAKLNAITTLPSPNDQVLIAFSGHGVYADGKGYLCPLDGKRDDPETMLALEDVYGELQNCAATRKLLILDAWRNPPPRVKAPAIAANRPPALAKPPQGLRVITGCEVGQQSLEDPKLKRGVFMYYLTKGLGGAADREVEGNNNGKVSVSELYDYTQQKTKVHAANHFAQLQMPVIKGEMGALWEIAQAAEPSKVAEATVTPAAQEPPLPKPKEAGPTLSTKAGPESNTKSAAGAPATHPLLTQGDNYNLRSDYDNAIKAYASVIGNGDLPAGVRRAARQGRGSAYLAKGGRENVQKALIDYKAVGLDAISLTITKASENLMENSNVVGTVKLGEVVQISLINGEWLWVASVNSNASKKGYIKWEAVLPPPPKPAPVSPGFNSFND